MYLSLGVPAVLPLGLVTLRDGGRRRICLMGVTLQHPPSHIFAYESSQFALTGGRAQDSLPYAERFLAHHGAKASGTIELELATLKYMGVGADALIGLGVGRALEWLCDLPGEDSVALARALALPPENALELWGFDQGGLLWVEAPSESDDMPRVLRRCALEHEAKKNDWVFVFNFPPVPSETPSDLSSRRRMGLLQSVSHLDLDELEGPSLALRRSVEDEDFGEFSEALGSVIAMNRAALEATGSPYPEPSEGDREVLQLMRDGGALYADRTPTGLGRFALIQGAEPSLRMRTRMRAVLGFERGTITATIVDNAGARQVVRDERVR